MPQETKSIPDPDGSKDITQGVVLELDDDDSVRMAFEVARDYRGDIEMELNDGSRVLGFVFDVDWEDGPAVRMDLPANAERKVLRAGEVRRIHLSGRDPAAGKSWENWVRRYAEKKLAGEEASIESESLD